MRTLYDELSVFKVTWAVQHLDEYAQGFEMNFIEYLFTFVATKYPASPTCVRHVSEFEGVLKISVFHKKWRPKVNFYFNVS